MKYNTIINNENLELVFSESLDKLTINNTDLTIDWVQIGKHLYSLIINGNSYIISINSEQNGYKITVDQNSYIVNVQNELDILLQQFGFSSNKSINKGKIHAEIPGLIRKIFVNEGEKIRMNQKLFILEAMKMENEINSPLDGIINSVNFKVGEAVEKGDLIMEIIS